MTEKHAYSEEEMQGKRFVFLEALSRMDIPCGTTGRMDCPVCGRRRAAWYRKVNYRGHIHAGCRACGTEVI